MKLLTKEQQESYENAKICQKKYLKVSIRKTKEILKLEITLPGDIEVLHI